MHYYNDETSIDERDDGCFVAVKVPHGKPDVNTKEDFIKEIEFMMVTCT
jgi:hypothetical protein